jgi:ATP-dependent DNA ligase
MRYGWLQKFLPKEYDLLPYELINSEDEADKYVKQLIEDEEEGACFKQPEEGWVAGHKGYRIMKKVKGVDYDLKCIGAEEGTGKYKGLVANLFFEWKDGKTIKCMLGKGWTHEDARKMWHQYNGFANPGYPIGEIFQVYALQESSKGKLRIPKVGELRHDKTEPDIKWEE